MAGVEAAERGLVLGQVRDMVRGMGRGMDLDTVMEAILDLEMMAMDHMGHMVVVEVEVEEAVAEEVVVRMKLGMVVGLGRVVDPVMGLVVE